MKSHSTWIEIRQGAPALLLVVFLAACGTNVTQTGGSVPANSAGAIPRPGRVLVTDFTVNPQAVHLDLGIGPRLMRTLEGGASAGTPAREVQDAIAGSLLDGIRKMGFAAERAALGTRGQPSDLVVQGEILKIDEGNRARRLAIGFGAGKSSVEASVQVYDSRGDAQPLLLQTYDAEANSGHKPGMGVGAASAAASESVAPAAVSGALGVHGERQGVAGEGQHLGNRIAYNLGQYFMQQGWIAASAAPPRL